MKFIIEVYNGWQGLEMKPMRVAEVKQVASERSRRKTLPWIKIMGDDDVAMYEGLALWAQKGCPSAAQLKAE